MIFATSDEVEEVEKYYDKEPASAGWTQQMKVEEYTHLPYVIENY